MRSKIYSVLDLINLKRKNKLKEQWKKSNFWEAIRKADTKSETRPHPKKLNGNVEEFHISKVK